MSASAAKLKKRQQQTRASGPVRDRGQYGGEDQHAHQIAEGALEGPVPRQGDVGLVEGGGGDDRPVGAADAERGAEVAGERAAGQGADGDGQQRRAGAEAAEQGAAGGAAAVGAAQGGAFGVDPVQLGGGAGRGWRHGDGPPRPGPGGPVPQQVRLRSPGARPRGGEGRFGVHHQALQRPAYGGGAAGGEQALPGGVDGGGRGAPRTGPGIGRARCGGLQGAGDGPAFGALAADQGGRQGDQPGERARAEGQGEVAGYLLGALGGEERGGADEREDHMAGRADAGGVAHRLLSGGEQRTDRDEHGGRSGERRGGQGDGEAGRHAEHHAGDRPRPPDVRQAVAVEGAERTGHRVDHEIEPAEGQKRQVGDGGGDDHAQGRLEPGVRRPREPQGRGHREPADRRWGGTAGGARRTGRCITHPYTLAGITPVN